MQIYVHSGQKSSYAVPKFSQHLFRNYCYYAHVTEIILIFSVYINPYVQVPIHAYDYMHKHIFIEIHLSSVSISIKGLTDSTTIYLAQA